MLVRGSFSCKCFHNGYLSNYRITLWAQRGLDFRVMINFRNQLFDCKDLSRENKIPVSEFRRIRGESDSGHVRAQLVDTEEMLLAEIAILPKHSNSVPLFTFMNVLIVHRVWIRLASCFHALASRSFPQLRPGSTGTGEGFLLRLLV